MSLRIRNKWHYKGKDWWDWEAFLDDDGSGELRNVDYVEYILHPTFASPLRKITNPRGGFIIKAAGWGTFELAAFVYTKDGKKRKLTHLLKLKFDPKEGVSE
jgi:transcription initiation factor IIF auxiliary subunit